jgi:hypothetical protein
VNSFKQCFLSSLMEAAFTWECSSFTAVESAKAAYCNYS